jgi:hypothetical protein
MLESPIGRPGFETVTYSAEDRRANHLATPHTQTELRHTVITWPDCGPDMSGGEERRVAQVQHLDHAGLQTPRP